MPPRATPRIRTRSAPTSIRATTCTPTMRAIKPWRTPWTFRFSPGSDTMSKDLDLSARHMDSCRAGGGRPAMGRHARRCQIVIKGSRFTSTGMGAEYEGTLELDASATPGADRHEVRCRAPRRATPISGIYQLDGDSWKLCLATRGTVRPASFTSHSGSGIAVETLVRGKAAPKARKAKSKAERVASGRRAGDGVRRRVAHALRRDERQGDGRVRGRVGQTRDAGESDRAWWPARRPC